MKTFFVIFACLSLIANAFLGYTYWHTPPLGSVLSSAGRAPSSRERRDRRSATENDRTSAPGIRADEPKDAVPADGAGKVNLEITDPQLAAALKSREPHELLAALKNSGFPASYIRSIMIVELSELTRKERLVILGERADLPFWQVGSPADDVAWDKKLEALDPKNLPLAKDVFGGKVPGLGVTATEQRFYSFLPADKIEAVYEIVNGYKAPLNDPANAEKRPALESQMHDDLAKILTPADLDLYDLTASRTAQTLRYQMQSFAVNEQEFRAMYAARRELDQNPPSPATRQADEAALTEKYRAILGDDRLAEFQRSQSSDYRAAFLVAQHYNLPATSATEVYNLRLSATQRLQAIRQNPDANAARTDSQALAQEVNTRLTQLLGTQGANAYSKMVPALPVQTR